MSSTVQLTVFVVPKDRPAGPLVPVAPLTIRAQGTDGLLQAAKVALTEAGYPKHRTLSFTPEGMVAYVEEEL